LNLYDIACDSLFQSPFTCNSITISADVVTMFILEREEKKLSAFV